MQRVASDTQEEHVAVELRRSIAALPLILAAAVAGAQLPQSSLAVNDNGRWRKWWSSSEAPTVWDAPSRILTGVIRWTPVRNGVDYAELRLAGTGEAWRTRVILVRINPHSVTAKLVVRTRDAGTLGGWAVDSASETAIVALNAGQFSGGTPWGWLVRGALEEHPPGFGPLSMAVVQEQGRELRLVSADSIAIVKSHGKVVTAFQSYPTLLEQGGIVPPPLRSEDNGVDLEHRDSRLAIGELRGGQIILALTRFEALGGALSELPFGPTVPEMSALMGALGCTKAVALDGGISGQMLLRRQNRVDTWRAFRRVPLGLVFLSP